MMSEMIRLKCIPVKNHPAKFAMVSCLAIATPTLARPMKVAREAIPFIHMDPTQWVVRIDERHKDGFPTGSTPGTVYASSETSPLL